MIVFIINLVMLKKNWQLCRHYLILRLWNYAQNYAGIMYLHNPSGGLASHSMGVCVGGWAGGGGRAGWSSDTPWCLMLLQWRQSPTVQAFWLVLRTSAIHGALPSSPWRRKGWSCYIHLLLLHTSPMKFSSYFAGPLACFNYLSCSWG